MSTIAAFLQQVRSAFDYKNGLVLCQLFQFYDSDPNVQALRYEMAQGIQYKGVIDSTFSDYTNAQKNFLSAYLILVQHLNDPDALKVYDLYSTMFSMYLVQFSGPDSNWQVPLFKQLSSMLVQLAFRVDKMTGFTGSDKDKKLDHATILLSKCFNTTMSDRNDGGPLEVSKKQAVLHVTNLAFKLYFKLRQIRMCRTFISQLAKENVQIEAFPKSQQVTYRYYIGRYYLFESQVRKAERELDIAFRKCTRHATRNKRLILIYLISARMVLGTFPRPELLAKYNLMDKYQTLCTAIKQGNLSGYQYHLERHMPTLLREGTYIMLKERVKVVIWRCLFRRVYVLLREPGKTPILPFNQCLIALQFSSGDQTYDMLDIECLLVSLMDQSYLKGYLHHQKQIAVLSKNLAFPRVRDVRVITERYDDAAVAAHLAAHPVASDEQNASGSTFMSMEA
ncbi:hypothetical protein INT44_006792 [Umbelopsis vinacea]|uniref:PCI domain-containing protein n=1 Tax=Umbelopsis vinacea TaxID=44442 RepID=A0A8H7PJ69_9FUNG|nr:hypothetical protein INT44_006792 [Umbelopsis vinacea]